MCAYAPLEENRRRAFSLTTKAPGSITCTTQSDKGH